ncbi:MAG: hypothetical protein H0U53_08930 [Actinobacteria bacterium]|nr:hypothetical protein [Actinomycetota bacterium]
MRKLTVHLVVLALLFAACGGGEEADIDTVDASATEDNAPDEITDAAAYPIFISSEVVVAPNRFLIGVLDENDAPIGAPDLDVSIAFEPAGEGTSIASSPMEFLETVPGQRGVYVSTPEFDAKGEWAATVDISGKGIDESITQPFEVAAEGTTPAIGAPAPPSDTPTADDVGSLKEISTAKDPDPRFYESSIAEALKAGEPFVVVFATPKFCSSQVCGPTLDDIAKIAEDFPKLTFIHSEIYEGLEPNNPPVAAVKEWGLPSEPWVFVVDAEGKVAAKYEGSVGEGEIRPVLEKL